MKSSGIIWDEPNLDKFIANPDQVVHGNSMKPFGGIATPKQRGKIIAYLKTLQVSASISRSRRARSGSSWCRTRT